MVRNSELEFDSCKSNVINVPKIKTIQQCLIHSWYKILLH